MPVYNAQEYLEDSIQSVLNQTFKGFEFIILDDGSTDLSLPIIEKWGAMDRRIRIVNHQHTGLSALLRMGLNHAKGEFIARMDADDISLPERFERQINFFQRHAEVGTCGTWMRMFGQKSGVMKPPLDDARIKACLLFACPMMHPTVMMRRSMLTESNINYSESARWTEDYDLWTRLAPHTQFANLPELLLLYRTHNAQVSTEKQEEQRRNAGACRSRFLQALGFECTAQELDRHEQVCNATQSVRTEELMAMHDWLMKLREKAGRSPLFCKKALCTEIMKRWTVTCRNSKFKNPALWNLYKGSTLGPCDMESFIMRARLWAECHFKSRGCRRDEI